MSLLRRRMMMQASEPAEEWDYFTVVASYTDMEVSLFPACKDREEEVESDFPGIEDYVFFCTPIPFSYSVDGGEWVIVDGGVELPENTYVEPTKITLNIGSRLRVKTDTTMLANEEFGYPFVVYSSYQYDVDGTAMSLIFGDDFKDKNYIPGEYCVPSFTYADYGTWDNNLIKILQPDIFLPAIVLCESCYAVMFSHCSSLTNSPTLPAPILTDGCYWGMFYGCEKLGYIKMLATDISANDCLLYFSLDVAPTGVFIKHPDMTSLPTGYNGIPEGWTVIDDTFPTNKDGMPESTEFSFPLFLNTEIIDEDDEYIYRKCNNDLITSALGDWCYYNSSEYDLDSAGYKVPDDMLNTSRIFIDGFIVTSITNYYDSVGSLSNILTTDNKYNNGESVDIYMDMLYNLFVDIKKPQKISKYPWEDTRPTASTSFEFPLYLNTKVTSDVEEDGFRQIILESESNEIYEEFYQWAQENASSIRMGLTIERDVLEANPIYIDGYRVLYLNFSMGTNFGTVFDDDSPYFGGDIYDLEITSNGLYMSVEL